MKFNGTKLRAAREQAGFKTQQALASTVCERAGYPCIDCRTLSRWESNPDAKPRKTNLEAVCDVLGISAIELWEEEESTEENTDKLALEVISKICSIKKYEKLRKILYIIDER